MPRDPLESVPAERRAAVVAWLELNRKIAGVIGISEDEWIGGWVAGALEEPVDFSFLEALVTDVETPSGGARSLAAELLGSTTAKTAPPATKRAKDSLSPALLFALDALLSGSSSEPVPVPPADVPRLAKLLPSARALGKLSRLDYRRVTLCKDPATSEIRVTLGGTDDLHRLPAADLARLLETTR